MHNNQCMGVCRVINDAESHFEAQASDQLMPPSSNGDQRLIRSSETATREGSVLTDPGSPSRQQVHCPALTLSYNRELHKDCMLLSQMLTMRQDNHAFIFPVCSLTTSWLPRKRHRLWWSRLTKRSSSAAFIRCSAWLPSMPRFPFPCCACHQTFPLRSRVKQPVQRRRPMLLTLPSSVLQSLVCQAAYGHPTQQPGGRTAQFHGRRSSLSRCYKRSALSPRALLEARTGLAWTGLNQDLWADLHPAGPFRHLP